MPALLLWRHGLERDAVEWDAEARAVRVRHAVAAAVADELDREAVATELLVAAVEAVLMLGAAVIGVTATGAPFACILTSARFAAGFSLGEARLACTVM